MEPKLVFIDLRGSEPHPSVAPPRSVVCLGNFDGVHRAHAVLLSEGIRLASRLSAQEGQEVQAGVFCFIRPTLDFIISPEGVIPVRVHGHLTTLRDKVRIFAKAGLDFVCLCDFPDVRSYSPEAFIDLLRTSCHCIGAVCGFNYFFGKGSAGTPAQLVAAFGEDHTFIQPEMTLDGITVSSSRIRNRLKEGDTETAERLLGRPYALETAVVHGKGLGHILGFPTANQFFPTESAIPARGVYAVLCHTPYGVFPGVANVGIRPTLDFHGRVNCETYIIGMEGDLYGKRIRTEFLTKLRNEQRFDSVDDLTAAIHRDAEAAVRHVEARKAR